MAELKPFEVIMRIDYAASKGPKVVVHAEKVQELVRCENCKSWNGFDSKMMGLCIHINHIMTTTRDFFCADGEVATVKNEDNKDSGDVKC